MINNIKCAVLEKINKPLKIHNIKFGKLKFGQVLVKIFYSGICGSQCWLFRLSRHGSNGRRSTLWW